MYQLLYVHCTVVDSVTAKHFSLLHQEFHQRLGFFSGLPPSPPSSLDGGGNGEFGNIRTVRAMKSLGGDAGSPKRKANGSLIAIDVLSSYSMVQFLVQFLQL
jgi:hypothetical protein